VRYEAAYRFETEFTLTISGAGTVPILSQDFSLEDAFGSHDCWLEASIRAM
jgi:hypothetical protein